MRRSTLVLGLVVAACASPATSTTALIAADAATSLAVGERVTQSISTQAASGGSDPVVNLTLRHADGRTLAFQQGVKAAAKAHSFARRRAPPPLAHTKRPTARCRLLG